MLDHEWINIDVNSSKQLVRLDKIYNIPTFSHILDFFFALILLTKICIQFYIFDQISAFLVPTTYVRLNSIFVLINTTFINIMINI